MGLEDVKVGDRLTIVEWVGFGGGSRWEFCTAARVTKTSVIDDKDRRWTLRGRRVGYGPYSGPLCRPFAPEDKEAAEADLRAAEVRVMAADLSQLRWRELDPEIIRELHARLCVPARATP